jgi:hypothetical protein
VIRPPSLQKPQDDYYSGDPAFIQLPADASDEQRKEHAHKWKVARETGNYSALLIEGQQATKFTMQPIKRTDWRAFKDRVTLPPGSPKAIGINEAWALAFRMSVVAVTVGADIEIKRYPHREWGGWDMADEKVVEYLDSIDERMVTELGDVVLARMSDIPKN